MQSNRLDQIREQLETELELADAEVGRLKSECSAAEKDQKAIRDAINALGKKPASSPKKPSVKKADMKRAVMAQLHDQPSPVPPQDLEAAIRDEFSRGGYSLTGLSLRFKEVLAGDGVEVTKEGVALVGHEVVNG